MLRIEDDSPDLYIGPLGAEVVAFPENVRQEIRWRVGLHRGDVARRAEEGVDYGDGSTGVVFNPIYTDEARVQEIVGNGVLRAHGVVRIDGEPGFERDGTTLRITDLRVVASEAAQRESISLDLEVPGG